jgi:hypothetical protein
MAGENLESKHGSEGIAEHKKDFLGRAAGHDEPLDALIGIGAAKASSRGSPDRPPHNKTETDKTSLHMEIWY